MEHRGQTVRGSACSGMIHCGAGSCCNAHRHHWQPPLRAMPPEPPATWQAGRPASCSPHAGGGAQVACRQRCGSMERLGQSTGSSQACQAADFATDAEADKARQAGRQARRRCCPLTRAAQVAHQPWRGGRTRQAQQQQANVRSVRFMPGANPLLTEHACAEQRQAPTTTITTCASGLRAPLAHRRRALQRQEQGKDAIRIATNTQLRHRQCNISAACWAASTCAAMRQQASHTTEPIPSATHSQKPEM